MLSAVIIIILILLLIGALPTWENLTPCAFSAASTTCCNADLFVYVPFQYP
jgi:hypothetical protein